MQNFYQAARSGDREQLKAMIAENPSLAVFAAAVSGELEELDRLTTADRSLVSAVSEDGWTPLHLAAHFGQTEGVRLLLNRGAQATARSLNALQNTPLHAAAAGRAVDAAKLLIDFGANVNATQHGGWTPLHAAAQNGDLELAKLLIENGADVSVRAENQQRPLDLALIKGQQAMVDLLESHGARL